MSTGKLESSRSTCRRRGAPKLPQPAFLPTWGSEVRERIGRTRCEPPAPATPPVRFFTKHETRNTNLCFSRITKHESRPFPFTGRQIFLRERTRPPDHGFHESRDTNHETRLLCFSRDTNHGLSGRSVRRGCARVAPPKTDTRAAVPAVKSLIPASLLPTIARYCSVFLPPSCCCPPLPTMARYCPAFPGFLAAQSRFPCPR